MSSPKSRKTKTTNDDKGESDTTTPSPMKKKYTLLKNWNPRAGKRCEVPNCIKFSQGRKVPTATGSEYRCVGHGGNSYKGARKKKLKMLSSSTVPKDNTSSVTPVKTEVQTSTGDGGEEDTPAFELAPLMS